MSDFGVKKCVLYTRRYGLCAAWLSVALIGALHERLSDPRSSSLFTQFLPSRSQWDKGGARITGRDALHDDLALFQEVRFKWSLFTNLRSPSHLVSTWAVSCHNERVVECCDRPVQKDNFCGRPQSSSTEKPAHLFVSHPPPPIRVRFFDRRFQVRGVVLSSTGQATQQGKPSEAANTCSGPNESVEG